MRSIDDFTRPLEYLALLDDPLGKIVRHWADTEVIPNRRRYDEDWERHELIEPAFDKLMAGLGLQRMLLPQDLGGFGMGSSSYLGTGACRIFEEVARADSGMAVAFGVVFWPLLMICCEPHVNRRLCEEFAPLFLDPHKARFAANAMTEPQGGADIENMDLLKGSTIRTTAKLDGDQWVINGHKLWPTNSGGIADLFGVVCTTDPGSQRPEDFAFIFVPANTPGVTQSKPYQKAGMAADKNSDIWFDNVRVPDYFRACGPGDDFRRFKEVVSFGNLGSLSFVSGVLLNTFEIVSDFCSKRRFRNKPLLENDDVAGSLADLASSIEVIRICAYQYARMIDRPDLYGERGSDKIVAKGRALKYFACDRAMSEIGRAIELMGQHGADRELDLEKHWRDLKIVQLWMGGKQLCQVETARWFYGCKTL
ncbi:MAG: acyl-CoA dehydrogenase family protein [Candidatus Alcyoniella australis]|nr:acyl-CoA dehydrogenase family protein [Candidatus Alcyoniella australis]